MCIVIGPTSWNFCLGNYIPSFAVLCPKAQANQPQSSPHGQALADRRASRPPPLDACTSESPLRLGNTTRAAGRLLETPPARWMPVPPNHPYPGNTTRTAGPPVPPNRTYTGNTCAAGYPYLRIHWIPPNLIVRVAAAAAMAAAAAATAAATNYFFWSEFQLFFNDFQPILKDI